MSWKWNSVWGKFLKPYSSKVTTKLLKNTEFYNLWETLPSTFYRKLWIRNFSIIYSKMFRVYNKFIVNIWTQSQIQKLQMIASLFW